MDKTTQQVLDRKLKENPEQFVDLCLEYWKTREITITEYRIYRNKFYKIMARLRRQERIKKLIRRLTHG